MNKYRRLLVNSGIFTVANFGTKLLNIVFVPLYTYWLTTSEYGTVDLVTTTINLLAPIAMLGMSDAVMRFAFDKENSKDSLLSTGIFAFIFSFVIVSLLGFIINAFWGDHLSSLHDNFAMFVCILFTQCLNSILAQYHRGRNDVISFAVNGILITLIQISMNVITLAFFKMGTLGYLISLIVSYIVPSIYLLLKGNVWKIIKFNFYENELAKKMLIYTLPLIPTNMMWWIMNLSSRYFVIGSLGLAANGIFAVSNKIPTVINMLNTIFQQAWQMSAIEEYNNGQQDDKFIPRVYEYFTLFMVLVTSVLLVFVFPIVKYTFSDSYFLSMKFIPYLLIAALFSNFAGFLGTNYVASKKTSGALKTSFVGAVINIILTYLFIKPFGLLGVSFAMIIAYVITWLYRIIDTRQDVKVGKLSISIKISLFVTFISAYFVSYFSNKFSVILSFICFLVVIIINYKYFLEIIKIFRKGH